jgi:hypothetical protein
MGAHLGCQQSITVSQVDKLTIGEASSYKQFAQEYALDMTDITAATFGIIIGCVYSGFLQAYANQKQKPSLDDIQEFHRIIKRRADQIKKGVLDAKE